MALAALLTQTLLPARAATARPRRSSSSQLRDAQHPQNALQHLRREIALTRKQGSVTLESLAKLASGVVGEEARARANHRRSSRTT
jgi:hypothetical protein